MQSAQPGKEVSFPVTQAGSAWLFSIRAGKALGALVGNDVGTDCEPAVPVAVTRAKGILACASRSTV